MTRLDLRYLFKTAWERAKESEQVSDDDPVVEHIKGSVIRAIAEVEVSRMQRGHSSIPQRGLSKAGTEEKKDPTIPAAA
jgi:hypothetical protein